MKNLLRAAVVLLLASPAFGQIIAPPSNTGMVVATCGTPPAGYPSAGVRAPGTVDTSGNACTTFTAPSAGIPVIPGTTATTTNSALGCYLVSAASTNATNCKASGGNFYGFRFINTTGTLYYLRLYNLSSSPSCNSATGFVESIPIPANTSGAGIVAFSANAPIGYSAGIGFCFTGGSSSSDNTAAAVGVFGALYYK